ncbi:unnamed protein product [Durusdinium trenchii]|uniref:Phospholipid scramblase n=1 Tax=Durusdinium trenchii TaxID=1381693 RepID=A0ABP0JZZ0_9DINO
MMEQYQVYGGGAAAGAQCNLPPPPPPPPPQPGMVQANAQGVYENVEVQQFLQNYPETEVDAPPDSRPRISEPAKFLVPDTTLNMMPSMAGDLLMSLSEGGLQYLLAGARANVGVKSGRYMFEVRVCECPRQEDSVQPQDPWLNWIALATCVANCANVR